LETLLFNLGLKRNENKGMWEPWPRSWTTSASEWIMRRGLFLIPPEKVDGIKKLAKKVLCSALNKRRFVHCRQLAPLAGKVLSVHLACPLARYRTRALFDSLSERWDWSSNVKLSSAAISDLRWRAKFAEGPDTERAMWTPPTTRRTLHTDAADDDWGAWLNYVTPARSFFSATERRGHITLKELVAVRKSIQS
jgi:hypothetical protein